MSPNENARHGAGRGEEQRNWVQAVNWTSSFRTPDETLAFWREHYGLTDLTPQAMAPYFEQAERRLNIASWHVAPNENNELLRRGAIKLGVSSGVIRRNVKGCWNLGSCGLGCPTNAKQSMLVTTLPAALQRGARLLVQTSAERFELSDGRVTAFIDPAVYYGHPETELAFITLFNTFGDPFFDAYHALRPIRPGFFELRRDIHNLYPLLVHARLFGSSYLDGVERVIARLGF